MQFTGLISLALLFGLSAHAFRVPEWTPPCPQFPSALQCEKNSWEAWEWHCLFAHAISQGWDDDCMIVMRDGNHADSIAWERARIIQSPKSTDEQRGEAAAFLHDRIGELRFNWGSMPHVTPFPYEKPVRKFLEPK